MTLPPNIKVLDGSTGTSLHMRGLPFETLPDFWNLEKPEEIFKLHQDYVSAGADVLYTNTFGASHFRLREKGKLNLIKEINVRGVELAQKAGHGKAEVWGSIGPIGTLQKNIKSLSVYEIAQAYCEQIHILADAGVDAICLETQYTLTELQMAVNAAKDVLKGKIPFMLSMSINESGLLHCGHNPLEWITYLEEKGVSALGFNCSLGPQHLLPVVQKVRKMTSLPLIAKPSAGIPPHILNPYEFSEMMYGLYEAGASYIGGCCGTTPQHIFSLKNKLLLPSFHYPFEAITA